MTAVRDVHRPVKTLGEVTGDDAWVPVSAEHLPVRAHRVGVDALVAAGERREAERAQAGFVAATVELGITEEPFGEPS